MEYSLTLSNGLTGDDLAHFIIAISPDGQIINQSGLADTSPLSITGFVLAAGDGRPASVSWADFANSDATLNVLGYQIVQRLADGREDVSEFTIMQFGVDY